MASDIYEKIDPAVRQAVLLLVQGQYGALEKLSKGNRLAAEDMRYAIEEYGRKLTMPPTEAFEGIDVIKIDGAQPQRWSARFDLWSQEEGRSDLSLEMTFIERVDGSLDLEIDDIHVL